MPPADEGSESAAGRPPRLATGRSLGIAPSSPPLLDEPRGGFRAASLQRLEFLALLLVVVAKERLDLVEDLRIDLFQVAHPAMQLRVGGDGDEPVVANPDAFPLPLLGLDRANGADGDDAAHRG